MGDFTDFRKAFLKALERATSKKQMETYGEFAARMIQVRTRLGKGVGAEGGEKSNLKRLADSTIESRKSLRRRGKLSNLTTPARSNLTQSGQMLESMGVISGAGRDGLVIVGPSGPRDDGHSNEDVAGFAVENGRPFNHLSRDERERLTGEIAKALEAILRVELTKSK